MRFHVSLSNSVSNTSGMRLVGGKLEICIAAPSASKSFSVLTAVPSPRIESKAEGNVHALVMIPVLDAMQAFESRIELEYLTSSQSFQIGEGALSTGDALSNDELCRSGRFWETKDPLIRRTSEKIRRSSRDTEDFLLRTFAWVQENVKLREPQPTRLGAAHTIRELTGDCDELSDLFIALCRTVNIRSRRVVGLFYHGRQSDGKPFEWHAWAEVQNSGNVWIPFDPSLNFFASISERHLPRCCMGIRSDYPLRKLTWRSHPNKPPIMNDDDVESVTIVPSQ